jgi:hypothetical protein
MNPAIFVAVVALVECTRVSFAHFLAHPLWFLAVPAFAIGYTILFLAPILAANFLHLQFSRSMTQAERPMWQAGLLAMFSALYCYAPLLVEPTLRAYLPLAGLFAALGLMQFLSIRWLAQNMKGEARGYLGADLPAQEGRAAWRVSERASFWFGWILIAVSLIVHKSNYDGYRGYYLGLHLSLLQVRALLVGIGLTHILSANTWRKTSRPRLAEPAKLRTKGPMMWLVLGTACVAMVWTGEDSLARRRFVKGSYLGQYALLPKLFVPTPPRRTESHAMGPIEAGARRSEFGSGADFFQTAGFPDVRALGDLSRYHVLLVSFEATRFDSTSLAEPPRDTTPNLRTLQDLPGTYSFRRAYSPSSGTLHSMAAMFTMQPTSAVDLETWRPNWRGELLPTSKTVAEIYQSNGFSTAWIGHNYEGAFETTILGLDQGFETVERICSGEGNRWKNSDIAVADAALRHGAEIAEKTAPSFSWIFFSSPHADYQAHDVEETSTTDYERYLQEIRFADREFGRVLQRWRELGLLERTIVIAHADHGEEFGEHGGKRHKATLYGEVIHVPLLVHIPGAAGGVIDQPVSTQQVFPWLFAHGNRDMQSRAGEIIDRKLRSLREATNGAVVSELLTAERLKSVLVDFNHSIHLDHASGVLEVYDLLSDPLEQNDLYERHPGLSTRARTRMDRYLTWRGLHSREAFRLDHAQLPQSICKRDEK